MARQARIDPKVWNRAEMVAALGARDVGKIFRILQSHGVSQRRIAALTGQSQSEISEILKGRRVLAYDVLARIADGFGVPRGRMGLAYDDPTSAPFDGETPRPSFDPGLGCWVVQVPVFVDSLEAAVGICESLVTARVDGAPDSRPRISEDHAAASRWIGTAGALLASRRDGLRRAS